MKTFIMLIMAALLVAGGAQAATIVEETGAENLRLMFDCYHVGRTEGDVITRLRNLLSIIGHIQFAAVPDREERHGIDPKWCFAPFQSLGTQ